MPLFKKIRVDNNSLIGIWEIMESLEELMAQIELTHLEIEQLDSFKNLSRKKQWIVSRLLIKELMAEKHTLCHDKNGSPYLKGNPVNISISHTHAFVAVILSKEFKVGIDIESINERVLKVKHKFLSDKEISFLTGEKNKLENICLAWSAKEALFKIFATPNLDFKKCINLESYSYEETGIIHAMVCKDSVFKNYSLQYQKIKDHILVYVISNK